MSHETEGANQMRVGRRVFASVVAAVVGFLLFAPRALARRIEQRFGDALPGWPDRAGRRTRALLGRLRPGTRVGDATIVAIHDVHLGAIPIGLRDARGRFFQVDVLLAEPNDGAIARANGLAFFLANGGTGDLATREEHGLAAMAIAERARQRGTGRVLPEGLLSRSGRRALHPRGRFGLAHEH